MARLVPDPEATAENLARVLRHQKAVSGSSEIKMSPAAAARRLLEELGVHCDETATLQDLKGFLLTSRYGTEIVIRHDLTEDERLAVYAHLVAHALLGPEMSDLVPTTRFEYVQGKEPEATSAQEVQEERVADAVARAILDGRLDAAPRMIYCRDLGPGRGRLSRAVLRGLHRRSLALYRRSESYQKLRSLPVFSAITNRVHDLLGNAA